MHSPVAYSVRSERLRDILKLLASSPEGVSSVNLVKRVFLADVRYYRRFRRQMTNLTYIAGCAELICWPVVQVARSLSREGILSVRRGACEEAYFCPHPGPTQLDRHAREALSQVRESTEFTGRIRTLVDQPQRARIHFSDICGSFQDRHSCLEEYRVSELKGRLDITMGIQTDRFCWLRHADELAETDELVGSLMQLSAMVEE